MKPLFSIMLNLQTHYNFKLDLQEVDQHTGGKWLIHGTNTTRTISYKALKSPVEYLSRESIHDTKESEGSMFNPIFKDNFQGQKLPGRCVVAKPKQPCFRKLKCVGKN